MNFTLLQAAVKSVGWEQLIFFVPLVILFALTIFIVIIGNSNPLIPTIYFLSVTSLLIVLFLSEMGSFSNIYQKVGMISFIIIFLLPGAYYLNKTIEQKKTVIESKENNLESDIYKQIKNLKELKEKGILTEEEFQDKKQKLLDKI
jgi:predicted neutral ceramidase superfamily lipid hydrolase